MASRFLRFIDLKEVCELLPSYCQGDFKEFESSSIPAPFIEELMWQFQSFLADTMPAALLDEIPEMVYPDEQQAPDDVAIRLDFYIATIFEFLKIALGDEDEDVRLFAQQACSEFRIYTATQGYYLGMLSHSDSDYVLLTAVLIYQYDTLCWLQKEHLFEEAWYVFDDIASIRCALARMDANKNAEARQEKAKSDNAKARAELRHKDNNLQKLAAMTEWDAKGHTYSSVAAFARHRYKAYSVTERTLYGWVRDHRKTRT